jgi:VIT1/CCC1 family predicted Fe2+/Mn2+ transporter
VTINIEKTPSLLRTFWSSEVIAESLYRFLAASYENPDRKKHIIDLEKMERGHAHVWNKIATDVHGLSFHPTLALRVRIVLLKFLARILPLPIFIHYLEHHEKKAILDYAGLLELYRDDEKTRKIVTNVIVQEISHEWYVMEQIADKRLYIAKVKEAIPGMMIAIIKTSGVVTGLVAAHVETLTIGLTGLITMIGGMIAEMSVSYISAKGHHDLNEGRNRELDIKKEVNPTILKRELEKDLVEKGLKTETVSLILDSVGDDTGVLSSLIKTMRTSSEALQPAESLRTTGLFFTIGALPIIAPFFIGTLWDSRPLIPAIIAFAFALVSISTAGLFMAVLSGKKIWTNITRNLLIIMGTTALTYLVGLAAWLFFGIHH